ncbi:glycoside hydrolase domain-containing protein [Robinsoniella peoriensis]|uniref:glycoside hydrolase domain-containing protein n=1 Tax=Robinsoniella peoriensis TaxID=180332 RepID=UPI0037516167
MRTWKKLLLFTLTFGMVFDNTAIISMAAENKNSIMEAVEGTVDIDDAVTTTTGESFKIQYEPEDAWHGGSGYYDLFLNGTDHYSDKSGQDSYYTMNFVGTGIEIYGSKNVNHSNTEVYIDDELAGEANSNLASGDTQHQQLLFSRKDLENGNHVLKVAKKSNDGKAMQVDSIRVYHEGIPVTELSLSEEEVRLGVGETTNLEVTAEPWVVENPEIEWTSADETVATVTADGVIKAVTEDAAETTITAAVKGTDVSAEAKVIVDPSTHVVNTYIGDEKVLELQEDYKDLVSAKTKSSEEKTVWKGDSFNSKIVVAAKKEDLHNVEVWATDFVGDNGNIISAEQAEIKWLKEVQANDGRDMAGEVKEYPDIIHQGGKTDIAAETVKFAWLDMDVPVDAEPGTYTGVVSVTADEMSSPVSMTYKVEVLDLVQPEPEATEIQIWQHPFAVANYYLGLGENPDGGISNDLNEDFYFTEDHVALMRKSMEEYASIGGHDAVANIVEEAWNHQSYYNDPSMVKWTLKADGRWEFDYTWYDAWINFMTECGVLDPENGIGQIKCYSIVPWDNQIAYYDEASETTQKMYYGPGSKEWKEIWGYFLEDFMAHSKANGWFELTYISMDERGLEELESAVEMIESVTDNEGKHFKISSALSYATPEYYYFTDRIDDISINQGEVGSRNQMKTLSEHRRSRGLTTTYYTATGCYPSNYTISDPGDNYWNIWYSMTLGTDGYLRWAWDNYVYKMHEDTTYQYWEPGDGWFIYPAERETKDGTFYSTPRYELFKQGIRDVAKAKYLMKQSVELKNEISSLVSGMKRPEESKHNGSAVAPNEEQRMLVHSETDRMYDKITELARTVEGQEPVEPPVDSTEPAPWGELPNPEQYRYQKEELAAFMHFGPNTFNEIEWGESYGEKSPDEIFMLEEDFDAETFVNTIKEAGFKKLIVTAKHHDGFCLWPSDYTTYDIAETSYKDGKGDILAEISEACTAADIDMGLYLSPWDIHDLSYGYKDANGNDVSEENDVLDYNDYYVNQLNEILGNDKYGNNGHFSEIWMDGAKGSGANAQEYDYVRWHETIQAQEGVQAGFDSECLIFQCGANTTARYIGNENGYAAKNTWSKSMVDVEKNTCDDNVHGEYSLGYEDGNKWTVPEADSRITSGWFWGTQKNTPKSLTDLGNMYFGSVGHNAIFLLNIPPNNQGKVDQAILDRVTEFGQNLKETFDDNMAKDAVVTASETRMNSDDYAPAKVLDGDDATYWTTNDGTSEGTLVVNLGGEKVFDVVSVEEAIQFGQSINEYKIEYHKVDSDSWVTMDEGETIGSKRLVRIGAVRADKIRITVDTNKVNALPIISEVGVYKASKGFALTGTAPAGMEMIDIADTDTADGVGFNFDSGWNFEDGNQYINGSNIWANPGAEFELKFHGSKVYLLGTTASNHGQASISIDGGDPITIDTWAEERKTGQIIFTSGNLTDKEHTLTLRVDTNAIGVEAAYMIDNGGAGMIGLEKDAYTMNEDETMDVKVVRVGGSNGKITAKLQPNPGSAIQDDFNTELIEDIVFEDGQTETTVSVQTRRNTNKTGNRQFSVEITGADENVPVGFNNKATITIRDIESGNRIYTEASPFEFPWSEDGSAVMEAEYGQILNDESNDDGWPCTVTEGDWASNGKYVDAINENDKLVVPYTARKSGTYHAVLTYQSGSDSNAVEWNEKNGKIQSGTQNAGASDSAEVHTAEFDFVVTEAGAGVLEFIGPKGGSPRMDCLTITLSEIEMQEYTITASAGEGGSIEPEGKNIVTEGEDISFTFTPDEGYAVKDVLVNGESVGAVTSYTFENVSADAEIEVVFETTALTTNLKNAIAMAKKLQEEQKKYHSFTEETWNIVEAALKNAEEKAANPNTTQEEADTAFLELMTAINLLESDVQKVGLGAVIEGAKAILTDEEGLAEYTEESVEVLRSTLAKAEEVYADKEATQTEINSAATELMTAVNNLLIAEEDNRLDILIGKAEELLQKEDQYTADSVQALKDVLDTAKDVAANKDASEEEINNAYNALAAAMTGLERVANKSELLNALNKAEEILTNAGKYTESSLEGLAEAKEAAQSSYEDKNVTQEEIAEVLKNLVNEILEVRILGDINEDKKVDSADAGKLLRYSAEMEELSEEQLKAADVNSDEAADSSDAGQILQYAAEIITEF